MMIIIIIVFKQEAQLSQRDRAMIRVIEYFAKSLTRSLKIIQNGTIRKPMYDFLFAFFTNYGSILYHFRDKTRHCFKISTFSYCLHLTPR